MVVGALTLTLRIPGARSLKEKRGVVRRTCDRLRHRFHLSVAEVEDQDVHDRAVIGVAAVGNDGALVNSVLDKVIDQVEADVLGLAELLDSRIELLHV